MPATLQPAYGSRGNTRTKLYTEANNAQFGVWDFTILSSGLVTVACATSTSFNSTTGALLGLATRQSRNTTNPGQTSGPLSPGPSWLPLDTPVEIFQDDMEVLLPVASSATAAGSAVAYSNVLIGMTVCLYRSSAGIWFADTNHTANPVLVCTARQPGPEYGQSANYCTAWWKVIPGAGRVF